ncbi:variable surface protein [Plasmodium gonderi]|uniref:Variable surface protein n=1 Tax=Plasmodium gonderi TaxID=77519 RepID=A0A1Y1JQD3_PLAGO|nr:variable surface protein [Plasmodium gonderi]GAW84649.1 variable surface protein [Plasmodium gonderi]
MCYKICFLQGKLGNNSQLAVSFGLDLTSEKFYDKLNDMRDFKEYYGHCESLESLKNGTDVKINCAKVLKYIKTYSDYINKNDAYDICLLLNYWLASRLGALVFYSNPSYVMDAFLRITSIWNEFIVDEIKKTHDKTCNPDASIIALRDWRLRKEVYDYYVDYDYLLRMSDISKKSRDYCAYIRTKVALYEHYNTVCISDETPFCDKFKIKYKYCDPKELLLKFECEEEMKQMRLLEEQDGKESSQDAPSEGTESELETSSFGLSSEGAQTVNDLQKIYNRFSPLKKTVGAILGILAILMSYAFLHNVKKLINLHKIYIFFTCLGSFIRNRFSNKNGTRSSINFDFNAAFDCAQELYKPRYNIRDEHYIGYHSY